MRALPPLSPPGLSAPSLPSLAYASCLLATLAGGCGGAAPRPAANADFSELQRAEASVVEALAIADSTDAPCEARCDALLDCDRAATAAHRRDEELSDDDFHVRAERLDMSCRDARSRVSPSCGCPSRP